MSRDSSAKNSQKKERIEKTIRNSLLFGYYNFFFVKDFFFFFIFLKKAWEFFLRIGLGEWAR